VIGICPRAISDDYTLTRSFEVTTPKRSARNCYTHIPSPNLVSVRCLPPFNYVTRYLQHRRSLIIVKTATAPNCLHDGIA
jgi:hypothetical protein